MAAPLTTTSAGQIQPHETGSSDAKPTLQESFNHFNSPFTKACYGNDITGEVPGEMLRFLKTENLSPYYRMKACIVLSVADEQEEENQNIASKSYWLKRAREALEEAKRTYTNEPDDARQLQVYEKMIEDEEKELHKLEKALYSSDEDDDRDEEVGY